MEARQYRWVTRGGMEPSPYPLSPHMPAPAAEQQRGWSIESLMQWTTEYDLTQGALLSASCANLESRTPASVGLLYAWVPNNREGPQARELSKCLKGWRYRERPAKKPSDHQLQEGPKKTKDSDRAITPVVEAVHVPGRWTCQCPCKPSSCATCMFNPHWGRAATGKKERIASTHEGHFNRVQLFATPWIVAYQASLSGGFPRQEYWSILANTGCHTLPQHYISCCPSPEYLVLPEPLRPKQLHHLLTWPSLGRPKSPSATSGTNPSGRPTCRGGKKLQLKPRGSVAKERWPKIFP